MFLAEELVDLGKVARAYYLCVLQIHFHQVIKL